MTPGDDLDVVHCLAQHQQNLMCFARPRARVAVVALPTPPLCGALGAEAAAVLARRRQRDLAALAELAGGGDGPAPIVDLDADTRPLPAILGELASSGVAELVLHGARDQPGFARAVASRSSLRVRRGLGPDGALASLMDDAADVRDLGDGVVRVRAGAAPPPSARVVLMGFAADPPLDAEHLRDARVRPYALDPVRALGPWSGFLPPSATRGPDEQARAAWLSLWRERGFAASARDAALGLDPVLEQRLAAETGRGDHAHHAHHAHHDRRAVVLAVIGVDGSGKSTHVAMLADALAHHGYRVRTIKLYRQGDFLELAGELGARTRWGAPLAAFRLGYAMREARPSPRRPVSQVTR